MAPTRRGRLQKYNHELVFANDEELRKYVKDKGWLRFKELKRVQKGGYAIYYYCKAIKWMDVRCNHMMLVVKEENGLIVGRTTDGGQPHEHAGMKTPKRGPKPQNMRRYGGMKTSLAVQTSFVDDTVTVNSSVMNATDVSMETNGCQFRNATRRLDFTSKLPLEETSHLLSTMDSEGYSRVLNEATPRLLEKMREAHEARKQDEEREAAAIFTGASASLIEKMIHIHRLQNRTKKKSESNETVESDHNASAAIDLFTNASPQLIARLKEMHELKKQQEEEKALKLFAALPGNKQHELLNLYYDDSISTITEH